MKTPERVSADEFIRAFVADHQGHTVKDNAIRCQLCNTILESARVYLSLHAAEFEECTGPGAVLMTFINLCPRCEDRPTERGCLHVRGML